MESPRIDDLAGWSPLEPLSAAPTEDVWRVARADRQAVLRRLDPSLADRWRGELDATARGAGEGVAALVDFGRLPDGRLGIWREWIPGRPLDDQAREREADALAPLLVRLCVALAGLHARGGVHGDLKAANVIVRPDGAPVLTDLGLGGGARAGAAGGGTLLGVAPECLRGAPADARSDLFALGSLLHGLLAGRFPNPRELYARFPGTDYPTATGIPLDALPEWSRALVGALLEREPQRRPADALSAARDLAARAGLDAPRAPREELRWDPLDERARWVETVRRSLRAGRMRAWRMPAGEDTMRLAHALRLELVTSDPHFTDLAGEGATLRLRDARLALLEATATHDVIGADATPRVLPAFDPETVAGALEARLDENADARAMAERLVRSGGGADAIDRELMRLQRRGALVPGPCGWRYEPHDERGAGDRSALEAVEDERLGRVLEALLDAPNAWSEAREEVRRLCDEGRAQRALTWIAAARGTLEDAFPDALAAEEAVAWTLAGREDEAERLLEALGESKDTETRALELRARGRLAARRYDHEAAREALARAAELDPEDGGDALYHSVRLAFERGDRNDLDRLLTEAGHANLDARSAWNIEAMSALACLRRGAVDEARRRFDEQIEVEQRRGSSEYLAAALTNRGTVERRAGRLELAVRDFEEAIELYESLGSTTGRARVDQWLGGTLRELGELEHAEATLRRALEARERSGDESGARAVRGSLGVLLADRGRPRAALDELTASADALERAGRRVDAAWMRAAADEVRARIGAGEPPRGDDPAPDPRVFLAAARHARWWGRDALARDWAERARSLAERLQGEAAEEEARWILARLAGEAVVNATWRAPRLAQDARMVDFLATPPATLDGAEALAFAQELERTGRDDRAARLAAAVALRTRDDDLARRAADHAARCFERAAAGLTEGEREVFARRLLDEPDETPEEAELLLHGLPEDLFDMDAMTLLEINRRLVEQPKLDELCREIVRSAVRMSGAERGFLVLEEDGEWRFDTALSSRHGDIDAPEVEVSRSILRKALDHGRPLRSSNAVDDPEFGGAKSVAELNLRSILCTPFDADESVRGVLYLDHRVAEEVFDKRAERLLGLLADQAALAIRQVRRVEEIQRLNGMLRERVATRESELETARRALRDAEAVVPASGLVGTSAPMREVHRLLQLAARAELPTLITGESGTGKELAARAVHSMGPRKAGPFVAENCAALPESLIETELFGAEKGAYTGADSSRPGLFERAHGGTVFLDEIGELPLALQAKLLRVLETGEVRRVGADRARKVDFRLVAATNRDLDAEVAAGRFREDLKFRLDAMRIELPPLREREDDVPALVEHFLRLEESRSGPPRRITPEVLAALVRRPWPGNVRELANEIARLCALSPGDLDDPALVRAPRTASPAAAASLEGTLDEIERRAIEAAVNACDGDKTAAAKRLGISRAKIYQRWKEWREQGASS